MDFVCFAAVDCSEFRLFCSHVQCVQAFYRCNTYVGHKNVWGVHVGHLAVCCAVSFVEPVGLRYVIAVRDNDGGVPSFYHLMYAAGAYFLFFFTCGLVFFV